MEYSVAKCFCVVLAAVVFCFDVSMGLIPSNVDNSVDSSRQNKEKMSSSMWFGSRLGRKKATENFENNKLVDILESLDEYPWTIIAINENNEIEKRGNTHNFTPRLGRNLDENRPGENLEISERSPPFSPRLGRGHAYSPYSPRLGRDESYRK